MLSLVQISYSYANQNQINNHWSSLCTYIQNKYCNLVWARNAHRSSEYNLWSILNNYHAMSNLLTQSPLLSNNTTDNKLLQLNIKFIFSLCTKKSDKLFFAYQLRLYQNDKKTLVILYIKLWMYIDDKTKFIEVHIYKKKSKKKNCTTTWWGKRTLSLKNKFE